MENENYYEDPFIVTLTIENTQYENVEVEVSDPKRAIRQQIQRMIEVFRLPRADNSGCPITYLLAIEYDNEESPTILEFEDADGREQTLFDYNVQPGDHLYLIAKPIAGGYGVFTKITISNKSLYIEDILDEEMRRYGYKPTRKTKYNYQLYEKSKLTEPKKEDRQEFAEDYYYNEKDGKWYCCRDVFLSKLPPERLYDGCGGLNDPMFLDQLHEKRKKGRRLCDYETEKETNTIQVYYIYTIHPHPKWGKDPLLKRMKRLILNITRR